MGFEHEEEADEGGTLTEDEKKVRDMYDPYHDEPAAKLANQSEKLRKVTSWAADYIKTQSNEKTEMANTRQNQQFAASNDKGDYCWSSYAQWGSTGTGIQFDKEKPQPYDQHTIESMDDFRVQLRNAHDSLFHKATGLSHFTDDDMLGVS
jgi:hypothetical protein